MKKLILVNLILVFVSCNAIGGDEYSIKGVVKNNQGKVIYLEKLSHKELKLIDSAKIDTKGNFLMKSSIEGLGFYRLRINENPQNPPAWLLTLERKENVEASLDAKDLQKYSIKGGPNQEEFQTMLKNLNAQQGELMQMSQQYGALTQNGKNPKDGEALRASIENKSANLNKYVMDMLKNSKNPLSNYYLYSVMLQQFANSTVPEEFKKDIKSYTEKMKKEMPNSIYTSDFEQVVKELSAQSEPGAPAGALAPGTLAPDVDLLDQNGKVVKLSSFRGKVFLLDFWASWCRPCRMENPNVVAAYKKYANKGFTVVSISQDKNKEAWLKAIKTDGLEWPNHFSDLNGNNVISNLYNVQYIPKAYLIGKDGKIIAMDLRGGMLEAELEKIYK